MAAYCLARQALVTDHEKNTGSDRVQVMEMTMFNQD
jgi:hypothetical protein